MERKIAVFTLAAALAALAVPSGAWAGDAEAGKKVFMDNCMSCHGPEGKGDGPVGAALPVKPRDFSKADFKFDTDSDGKTGTDADIRNVVENGAAKYGGSPLMAPLPQLSDEQIDSVIAYIRTLHKS
jgi:mono/diheme cytochrome c family protein